MENNVEENIKNAFDNWDNQSTDVGFDKGLVWKEIQKDEKEKSFVWRNIAASILVLVSLSGLAYSFILNNSLVKVNDRLVARLQMQSDSIFSLQTAMNMQKILRPKSDTIVKKKSETVIVSSIDKELEKRNELLAQELKRVNFLLEKKNDLCGLLSDSVKALITSLQSVPDVVNKTTKEVGVDLQGTDVAEYLAMSKKEPQKESKKESKQYRPRFKIVLFNNNKDKETAYEAPRMQGIRF